MRRGMGWWAAALLIVACGGRLDTQTDPLDIPPDGGSPPDAGPGPGDAGPADAGRPVPPPLPTGLPGAQVYAGPAGLPAGALGVGVDEGGHVWVASPAGLHHLPPGGQSFETFTGVGNLGVYEAISVAGGRAGQAVVGYKGVFGCCDDADPPELLKSGDADLFALSGGSLGLVRHYDLHKGNVEKDRTALTVVFDRDTSNVWFGMNHGLAMWYEAYGVIQDHRHPEFATGSSIRSSQMHGVTLDARGSVWMGMAYRTGILPFATAGGSPGSEFWAHMLDPSPLDVWPAGQSVFPGDDDHVHGIAMEREGVAWIASFGNGLARVDTLFSPPDIGYWRASDGLPDEKLTDVVFDPDGTVWAGTNSHGIFRLNPATGEVRTYLGGSAVADLYLETHPGGGRTVYVATRGGLVVYGGP